MAEIIRSSNCISPIIALSKVDIFGQNITLNMNKNASYTTAFGGFSSILIICLLSIIFFSNIVEYFGKQNVTYDSEISFSNAPEQMIMNDENAMIALSIDQTNFSTNPFFNVTVERKVQKRLTNGSVIKETIEIPLIPCTLDRFNSIFEKQKINFTDQFNFLSLEKKLCPDFNQTFSMQGTYSSEIFEYVKITVKDCENQTYDSERIWKPTCSSEAEKTKYYNKNGEFKLQVFQINTVVNPQKAEDYKSIYIDSDMYFTFVPKKLSRLANVYYRQFLLYNDNSILPYEDIEQEKVIVRKAEDFRDLTQLGRDTDDTYVVVYMRISPFKEIIFRRFEKLGELLAYLGGFMQIMRVVFGFIIALYNRTAMLVELSNKLYDFNDNSNINELQLIKTLKQTDYQISSNEEKQDLEKNQINLSQKFQQVKWKDYVKQLIRKSKPITFNLKIFFNQLSFGYFFKNKNSEFLEKAMIKINTELDLHSILYQLQEINKLKQVLLRKSQIILFDFSPKPIINLGKDQLVLSRYAIEDTKLFKSYIKKKEDTPKEELFLKLEEAYKEIGEEIDNKSNICQMNINLKLINLIGSDVKAILKPLLKQLNDNVKKYLHNNPDDQNEQREEQ